MPLRGLFQPNQDVYLIVRISGSPTLVARKVKSVTAHHVCLFGGPSVFNHSNPHYVHESRDGIYKDNAIRMLYTDLAKAADMLLRMQLEDLCKHARAHLDKMNITKAIAKAIKTADQTALLELVRPHIPAGAKVRYIGDEREHFDGVVKSVRADGTLVVLSKATQFVSGETVECTVKEVVLR